MKRKILFYSVLSLLICTSCKDVVEDDIDDENVVLHSPPNRFITTNSNVEFWWDEIEGANEYRIQVVQPEFRYVEKLAVDSISIKNKFKAVLTPGSYQWKIIAQNNGHKTESSIWSFVIDSANNITQVTINLISPAKDLVTNKKEHTFTWETNPLVEDYRFEIKSPDWATGSLVMPAQITDAGSFTNSNSLLQDGSYEWGVQGLSGTSNTLFSTSKITIDATPPGSPILNLPSNNSSQNDGNVTFTWNRPNDEGTIVKDSFFIYTDASLTNLYRPVAILTSPSYSDSLAVGTYYWRVRSFDEADNSSSYSTTWNIEITQ